MVNSDYIIVGDTEKYDECLVCVCGKAIEGRWVGLANFCPWCGRVMECKKDGDTN